MGIVGIDWLGYVGFPKQCYIKRIKSLFCNELSNNTSISINIFKSLYIIKVKKDLILETCQGTSERMLCWVYLPFIKTVINKQCQELAHTLSFVMVKNLSSCLGWAAYLINRVINISLKNQMLSSLKP